MAGVCIAIPVLPPAEQVAFEDVKTLLFVAQVYQETVGQVTLACTVQFLPSPTVPVHEIFHCAKPTSGSNTTKSEIAKRKSLVFINYRHFTNESQFIVSGKGMRVNLAIPENTD